MTDDSLRTNVGGFVNTLNELVGGVLDISERFEAEFISDRRQAIVRPPYPEADKVPAIPLTRGMGANEGPSDSPAISGRGRKHSRSARLHRQRTMMGRG